MPKASSQAPSSSAILCSQLFLCDMPRHIFPFGPYIAPGECPTMCVIEVGIATSHLRYQTGVKPRLPTAEAARCLLFLVVCAPAVITSPRTPRKHRHGGGVTGMPPPPPGDADTQPHEVPPGQGAPKLALGLCGRWRAFL